MPTYTPRWYPDIKALMAMAIPAEIQSQLKSLLNEIKKLLSENEGRLYKEYYEIWFDAALSNGQDAMETFLMSNELWGGSGSICDSALIEAPIEKRIELQSLLIQLAELQIANGLENPRTVIWSSGFGKRST
jgi:hypothetical protein